jgi:hypothetical protein
MLLRVRFCPEAIIAKVGKRPVEEFSKEGAQQ